jgi:dTDP-4-amino-4,6-dideoxygalactose transaminase
VYHRYAVRVPGNGRPDRDAFARGLGARDVRTSIPVVTPVHRLPGFDGRADLPRTEQAAAQTLALPMNGLLAERDVEGVVGACNALGGLL